MILVIFTSSIILTDVYTFVSFFKSIAAFNTLTDSLQETREILSVRRHNIVDDIIERYQQSGLEFRSIKVQFQGEQGDDLGGLTKDLFTNFWTEAFLRYFKGESAMVPHLPLHQLRKIKGHLTPLGRILTHTVAMCKFIPSRMSRSFLLSLIYDTEAVSDEIALQDFLLYLTAPERMLVHKARSQFSKLTETEFNNLLTMYSVYGLLERPKAAEIDEQLKTMARNELIDRPAPLISLIRKGIPETHKNIFWSCLTLPLVDYIFEAQRPTPQKLLEVVKTDTDVLRPEEEKVLYLFHQFILSLDQHDLDAFLLFVTASTIMPNKLLLTFNKLEGLARRPIAHTCTNNLELSITYTSIQELKRELRYILVDNESFCMDTI